MCFTQTEVKKLTGLNKGVMLVDEFLGNMNLPWAKFQAKEEGARLIENVNNDVGFATFAYCFNNPEN